jgi:hypothetical protein
MNRISALAAKVAEVREIREISREMIGPAGSPNLSDSQNSKRRNETMTPFGAVQNSVTKRIDRPGGKPAVDLGFLKQLSRQRADLPTAAGGPTSVSGSVAAS